MFDFKGFISSILGRAEDGSVNNLKTATQFMQELDADDYVRAQTEVTRALAELNQNARVGIKERVRTVLYLDEKAQVMQVRLRAEWLENLDASPAISRQLQPTLLAYWQQQQLAFKSCIRNYAKNPSNSLVAPIKLVVARAMAAYSNEAVSSLIRYVPVEDRVWRNLHRLYSFSEAEGFAEDSIQLYPDGSAPVSCNHLYLRLAMLHLSQPERLPVTQLLHLDAWLQKAADCLTLESQIRPHRQTYVVNLGTDTPPRRLRRTMIGETYRYWATDALMEKVQDHIGKLMDGENPVTLGFGEGIRTQECMALLSGLVSRWSRESDPMLRKHERASTQKSITVAQGLKDVVQHLRVGLPSSKGAPVVGYQFTGPATVSPQEPGHDALFESKLEEWLVQNQSATGVGASFHPSHMNDLKVGTLIGLRADADKHSAVGVVRRLQNSSEGHGYVGIETLSQTPLVVELREQETDARVDAIYLPEIKEAKQARSLLLAASNFQAGKVMRLAAQGKAYLIRLHPAVEETRDFARTNFDVVGKG